MSVCPRSPGLATLALLVCGCLPCPDPFYEFSAAKPQVRLPLDEAPHCFGGGEWWYYTGRLTADTGQEFGIETVIFHVPQLPILLVTEAWAAHYAVTDVDGGQFYYDQAASIGPQWCSTGLGTGFDLGTPLVSMRGGNGQDSIEAAFADGRYALHLALTDARGPVLHGDDGYVPYGAGGASFYYSRPRMDANGTLCVGDMTLNVSGQMWFDRQWGRDLDNPLQRWDWYSIRLDNGSDIMLFVFPGDVGQVAFGTLMPASSPASWISAADFRITPSAVWVSPATGTEYEVGWQIELPGQQMVLALTAVVEEAELDARATTQNTYWEGLCTVVGQSGDQAVTGYAYVEQANGGA
ncbi:MAG TPA: lipocalin-like domain-containing protein [Phycisphaerae bacterium]|nr:lipocalin-like domain-containing protein [Phycisphaerae bacterium]